MKRVKGVWAGEVEILFDFNENETYALPFDILKKNVVDGVLCDRIRKQLQDEVDDLGTVTVNQKIADLYEYDTDELDKGEAKEGGHD